MTKVVNPGPIGCLAMLEYASMGSPDPQIYWTWIVSAYVALPSLEICRIWDFKDFSACSGRLWFSVLL